MAIKRYGLILVLSGQLVAQVVLLKGYLGIFNAIWLSLLLCVFVYLGYVYFLGRKLSSEFSYNIGRKLPDATNEDFDYEDSVKGDCVFNGRHFRIVVAVNMNGIFLIKPFTFKKRLPREYIKNAEFYGNYVKLLLEISDSNYSIELPSYMPFEAELEKVL